MAERHEPASASQDGNEDNDGTNVFVVGLQQLTRQKDLLEICAKYGKVETCEIMVDPHTELSRGFGFVKMSNKEDASQLIAALNGSKIDGAPIRARLSRRGGGRPSTPGVFLGRGVGFPGYPPPGRDPYYRDPYRDYYARDPYYRPMPPPHAAPLHSAPPPSTAPAYGQPYERDPYYRDPYYDPRARGYEDPYRARSPYDYPPQRRDPYAPPPTAAGSTAVTAPATGAAPAPTTAPPPAPAPAPYPGAEYARHTPAAGYDPGYGYGTGTY